MEVNYLRDISDFLGKEDKRYFSYGFKFFDYQYEDLCYEDKVLSGNVITNYYMEQVIPRTAMFTAQTKIDDNHYQKSFSGSGVTVNVKITGIDGLEF